MWQNGGKKQQILMKGMQVFIQAYMSILSNFLKM